MISQIFVVVCLVSAISAQTWAPSTSTSYSTTWQPSSSSTTEQPKQSDACCAITACNYEKIEIVQKLLAMASSLENSIKAPKECQQQMTTTMTTTMPSTTSTSTISPPLMCDVETYCHSSNVVPSDILDPSRCTPTSYGCATAMASCSCVDSRVPVNPTIYCDNEPYCHNVAASGADILDPSKCSGPSVGCTSAGIICTCNNMIYDPNQGISTTG